MTARPGVLTRPAMIVAITLAVLCGCTTGVVTTPAAVPVAAAPANPSAALLNSVLWYQTAPEAAASYVQAYAAATTELDRALADPAWTAALEQTGDYQDLPPAVILDIDETVLDNSPYEARLVREGKAFDPATWTAWVEEAKAKPLPGAVEFTRYAASRGVMVFFVTNRNRSEEGPTRQNLLAAGFPLSTGVDNVITRGELSRTPTSDKGERRAAIAGEFRILLLCGDSIGDFVSSAGTANESDVAARHPGYWGERWIVLPNPMYGSWERQATKGAKTPAEQTRQKIEALRTD
ncbi:MAG: HAD family acid phosphatase [Thermoanaerobaculia bacterium]